MGSVSLIKKMPGKNESVKSTRGINKAQPFIEIIFSATAVKFFVVMTDILRSRF
jgi:hypothetical protein